MAGNKVVADLRRNALHVVRQVAESGAGKSSTSSPLTFHAVRTAVSSVAGREQDPEVAHSGTPLEIA